MERNFCLLILLTCNLFANENFWFSYRVVTENKEIIFEERNISPLMEYSKESSVSHLCSVAIKKVNKYEPILDVLNKNYNKILPCFYPLSTKMTNRTYVENGGVLETTELIILPVKFTVDFNDQFANINLLR